MFYYTQADARQFVCVAHHIMSAQYILFADRNTTKALKILLAQFLCKQRSSFSLMRLKHIDNRDWRYGNNWPCDEKQPGPKSRAKAFLTLPLRFISAIA